MNFDKINYNIGCEEVAQQKKLAIWHFWLKIWKIFTKCLKSSRTLRIEPDAAACGKRERSHCAIAMCRPQENFNFFSATTSGVEARPTTGRTSSTSASEPSLPKNQTQLLSSLAKSS